MGLLSQAVPMTPVLERPHGLLEGPRLSADGDVVYSDVLAGGLWACSKEGPPRELLPRRRGIGGIAPHVDGGWVISGRTVLHVAPGGEQRELLAEPEARGYNDLGSTPAGGLLAGALHYLPFAGEEPCEGRLVLLEAGQGPRVLCEQLTWPNGIGVTPDGRTVYISDYARRLVLAVPIEGGEADTFAVVPEGSADGLALDAEGGVWVALGEAGAVARFHPDGSLDEVAPMPAGFVSSISFGGPDMRDVLISTADNEVTPELGGTILRARSEVAGLPVTPVSV